MRQANFHVKNAAGAAPELYIYDDIGPDWAGMVSGETVARALAQIGNVPTIKVRLNSPGGDVFEGFAIYNALVRHSSKIEIEIDSLAASAASLIAMAGDTVRIAENAMMMVHNAWTIVAGNKNDLAKTVLLLDKIDGNLASTYTARTGLASEEIVGLLDAETWFTAAEAVEKGFADEINQPLAISNKVRAGRYLHTPAHLLEGTAELEPAAEPAAPVAPRRLAARVAQWRNDRARSRCGLV